MFERLCAEVLYGWRVLEEWVVRWGWVSVGEDGGASGAFCGGKCVDKVGRGGGVDEEEEVVLVVVVGGGG